MKQINEFLKLVSTLTPVKWLLIGVFPLHLLCGHAGLQGYVLCIESDGRLVLEFSIDQSVCDDSETPYAAMEPGVQSEVSHMSAGDPCGDCVDVPIFSACQEHPKTQSKNSPSRLNIPASTTNALQHPATAECHHKKSDFIFDTSIDPSFKSLRTTLLLI